MASPSEARDLAPPRFLVLTAPVGAGYIAAAEALRAGLLLEIPQAEVTVVDALSHMGRPLRFLLLTLYRWQLERAPWLFGLLHASLLRLPGTGAAWRRALGLLGGRSLQRAIVAANPDLVVSTYPPATNVLGELRSRGSLARPVCATITDLAGVALWAHRGIALHLVAHPDLRAEVERVAGPGSARAVRPLVHPRFYEALDRDRARRELGVSQVHLVLVSGGGWGIGDLPGAVAAALDIPGTHVMCVVGLNHALRDRLTRRYHAEPRVTVLGFVSNMATLLTAADVAVHSTGGVTVLEALVSRCPVVAYGGVAGHLPMVNRRMDELGLVRDAATPDLLRKALGEILRQPRPAPHSLLRLPDAACEVASLLSAIAAESGTAREARQSARKEPDTVISPEKTTSVHASRPSM
jgi:processive 1,2-diacylglycerol beta-glucosyltransferase